MNYFHYTDRKTEATLVKTTWLETGKVSIQTKALLSLKPRSFPFITWPEGSAVFRVLAQILNM